MAEYHVGDKVTLKDDGLSYEILGVRTEDRVILYDLRKDSQYGSIKLTVLSSQIEVPKIYKQKYPQVVVYKKLS